MQTPNAQRPTHRRAARCSALVRAALALAFVLALTPRARAQQIPPQLAASQPAVQVNQAPKPTTEVDPKSCVTAQCHVDVKNYKVIHGPVNVNACNACHTLTDAKTHTFTLARDKNKICTFCHTLDVANKKDIHKPVQTGECLACHSPHGGKNTRFIRGDSLKDVCVTCHKDQTLNKKYVHGPVAAGACDACHTPHASDNPKLLVAQGKVLCLNCHKEMGDQLKHMPVVHKPVADGECSQCHDPHASNYVAQTKAPPAELCTSCHQHDKIKDLATRSAFKHDPVMNGKACLNCHTAHAGTIDRLLRDKPVNMCLKCHNQDLKTPDGRDVPAVSEILDPKMVKHGPVAEGNCSGCHNVHGSDVSRLLAKPYPSTFYANFTEQDYALCFTCHDKKLAESKTATAGVTGFRNGTRNLHYVHVDRERGRTCRACHETHASPNPLHIRNAVPFGQWELPINFKKTDTGGSCAPGCHKPQAYDRVHPADETTEADQPKEEAKP